MPSLIVPYSDLTRTDFGRATLNAGPADRAAGKNYVTQESLDRVAALLPPFIAAYNKLATTLGKRHKEIEERNASYLELGLYVRHAWDEVYNRFIRLHQSGEVLQFYGLPLDGTRPRPTQLSSWVNYARTVIEGNKTAVIAGYPPLYSPTQAEIEAVLNRVLSEEADVAPADRAYDEAQAEVASLRPALDEAISDVLADLQYSLRKEEAPSQRRIMRTYGAKYDYAPGEPIPPDETDDSPPSS